jgi:DNA-binding transcriptional LysR family regulator
MSPELRYLRYFLAVAEELSFSAAARRLHVSQQALSRAIKHLERELGVSLFHRTTHDVALTATGAALVPWARRSAVAAEDAFEAARRAGRGEHAGPVRVDLSWDGMRTGALIMRQLRREHPRLPVEQVFEGVPRGIEALQDGRLGALLGLATHCPPELTAELVRLEPVLIGMAAGHELARHQVVPVDLLADTDLLLPPDESGTEWVQFVRFFCAQAGVLARRWPGTTTCDSAAVAEVVREGVCVVPTLEWYEPPHDLVFRPLVAPTPLFPWSIMTDPYASGDPGTAALLAVVRAVRLAEGWPHRYDEAAATKASPR